MEEKFKEDKKSYLLVLLETKTQIGNKVLFERKWVKANKEVDLGSFKNPNTTIVQFKYDYE